MQSLATKFSTGIDPFIFDGGMLASQHRLYQNDLALDFQYELFGKDHVRFWCQLYKQEEYLQLAPLVLLLLVISPTSVLCERGFSVMNYVKNEFRSVLTQQNLNASMALAMTKYNVETFPFTSLNQ